MFLIKLNDEASAAMRTIFRFQGAILLADNHTGQSKTNTDTVFRGIFSLIEAFKEMGQIFFGEAWAIVLNDDLGIDGIFRKSNMDRSASGRMFHAVFEDI